MKSLIHLTMSLSFVLMFITGCGKRPEELIPAIQSTSGKSGNGIGIVERISTDRKFVTLAHNDIPGIMSAMAMEYPVQSPDLLKNIHEKDSVSFTLVEMLTWSAPGNRAPRRAR